MAAQDHTIENSFIIGNASAPLEWLTLLERGLKLIPTPNTWNHHIWTDEVDIIINKIATQLWFKDKTKNRTDKTKELFINIRRPLPKPWTCRISSLKEEHALQLTNLRKKLYNMTPNNTRHNLSSAERKTIRDLKNQTDWIIKPADKGSGTVLWERALYITEAQRQLDSNNYSKLENSRLNQTCQNIENALNELIRQGLITMADKNAMTQSDPRKAEFYLLPKIHKIKTNPPGRPILSGNGHPTEWVSAWVDYHIQPLMLKLPTYLRDTTDLLNHIKSIKPTRNTRILSLDVTSLYTNIPQNLGVNSIRTVGATLDPNTDYSAAATLAQ